MKKLYILLITIMVTTLSFAQGPVITMIADGDCAGGNPRVIEIYANGAVDFTTYSLEKQTNGNTTWSSPLDLSPLGTVTDAFVYVYRESSTGTGTFAADFPSVTTNTLADSGSTLSVNGDDRIRLIETASSTVIDQYGEEGVDGSGTPWEYKDGYGKRNANTNPNAGVFNAANWTNGNGALNGFGVCQAGATFESIIGLGTYTPPTGVQPPTLVIASPTQNAVIAPGGNLTITYAINNFNVATAGNGDGHFHYMLTGPTSIASTPVFSNTGSLALTGLAPGSYTLFMDLRTDTHASLTPAVEVTRLFTVADITQVTDITALRADVATNGDGGYYEITGESLITHTDGFRNRHWMEDTTISGIVIYDLQASPIMSTYAVGDKVSGLKGQVVNSNGTLRFLPTEDSGTVVSSTNPTVPQIVGIAAFNAAPDDYESELIKIVTVTFPLADGTAVFATGTNYDFTDGTDTSIMRTAFYGADYIGELIPSGPMSLVGIAGEYNGTSQIYVRNLADITVASLENNTIAGFTMYPNPVNNGILNITTSQNLDKNIQIFNILGKQVLTTTITNTTVNVSNLNAGIYLIRIEEAGYFTTRKLVIK